MQKWEYIVLRGMGEYINYENGKQLDIDVGKRYIHTYLNVLGREGWELVGQTFRDMHEYYLILKCPLDK